MGSGNWLLLVGLLVSLASSTNALRMRGEELPGLAAAEKQRPMQLSSRIVGGELAGANDTPWLVSLQNQYIYHICGAIILDKRWILTAASCVAGLRARNLQILTGTTNWWDLNAPVYFIDSIHLHCNFDKPLYHNDIALLYASSDIEFDDVTAPIELAQLNDLQKGDVLTFAGWGSQSPNADYPQQLYKSQGTYLPYEECRSILGDTDDVDVGHVCVQMEKGKGMCHGDTGGPLVNDEGKLVGVANWGVPCGHGYPDVYADISFYNDWISSTINGCTID